MSYSPFIKEALNKPVRGEYFPFAPSIHRAARDTQDERKMYRTIVGLIQRFLNRSSACIHKSLVSLYTSDNDALPVVNWPRISANTATLGSASLVAFSSANGSCSAIRGCSFPLLVISK